MASIIKLKRSSTASSVPTGLAVGEIAVNLKDKILYVGNTTGSVAMSGSLATTTDTGVASFASGDFAVSGAGVVTVKTGGIDNGQLAADAVDGTKIADDAVDSEHLAADAVDATALASDSVVSASIVNKSIVAGDIADATITATQLASGAITANAVASNSVALGSKTTGDYIADASASGGVLVTGTGEGASLAISLDDNISANTSGTAGKATVLATARTIGGVSFNGGANINLPGVNASGNQNTSGNAATSTKLAATKTIGGVAFDGSANINLPGVNASGNQDTSGTAAEATILATGRTISTTGDVAFTSGSFDGSGNVTGTATIQANSVNLGAMTTGNYVATASGTANEIEVSGSGGETAGITIGLPNDVTIANDLTVSGAAGIVGNVTIDGNLTVEGATTYISSSTVNVDDSAIKLSANNAADSVDIGMYGKYVVGGTATYGGWHRDASDSGIFKFYKDITAEPTTTVNTAHASYAQGTIEATIDGGTY